MQKKLGISDSTERFYADTMAAGDRENDPRLVDILVILKIILNLPLFKVQESASAVNFLIENGVDLADINLCGGHSVPRTHWFAFNNKIILNNFRLLSPKEGKPLPVGVAIIRALKAKLEEWRQREPERLEIRLGTPVLGLVTWNDFITGVRVLVDGKIGGKKLN